MRVRAAGLLSSSLAILMVLAACGSGAKKGPDEPSAFEVEVTPAQIDVVSEGRFGDIELEVTLPSLASHPCAIITGDDFLTSFGWGISFLVLHPNPDLVVGQYTGEVEIFTATDLECNQRDSETRRIPYHLTRLGTFVPPSAVSLRATAGTTADELRGSARIDIESGPEHGWRVVSAPDWITIDGAVGVTGTAVRFHVNPASLNPSDNGKVITGAIELAGDLTEMTHCTVGVSLELDLPEVRVAMPSDQLATGSGHLRVFGRGFSEQGLVDAHLTVVGVPGAVFTRLDDKNLTLQLPPSLPTGTYGVLADNALGLSTGSVSFQLTAPAEASRTVLPGNGAAGRMLWDGARQALLVLEAPFTGDATYSTTLRRHALSDGAWTTTLRGVNSLRRMGFSPGGTELVAISDLSQSSPRVYAFDPVTLQVIWDLSWFAQKPPEPPSQAPLAVTVDGRAWSGTLNAVLAFDLVGVPGRDEQLAANPYYSYKKDDANPCRTIASRDGGTLLISRLGHPYNSSGEAVFDAISDDGSRVLAGANLYDDNFFLLGSLPGPGIISGDGRRAFTLETRCNWELGGPAPLVHVFDLTVPAGPNGLFFEIGALDLLDHTTCEAMERVCAPTSSLTVTPDARVMFVQTAGGVVVVPIPQNLAGR
jgi:hypothetical protein